MSRVLRASLLGLLATFAIAPAAHAATPKTEYFVALGDSYTVGYQDAVGHTTNNGPADQLVPLARKRGYRYKLVNLGCGGATTTSVLKAKGCNHLALEPGAAPYDTRTQVAAAERFLRAHKGKVGLITVSIGGNDVTSCAKQADPIPCVGTAVNNIKANVTSLVKRLRKAGGSKVRIVGTTYPDVILGAYLKGTQADQDLAKLSVVAFKSLINPALKKAYASVGGKFVDVTAATGAYGSLEDMTTLAPYGTIPTPVAKVCSLTYFCNYNDIHMTTKGYGIIADLIARTLPRR
jgi:lysophospholipase L1-like esterase